MDQPKLMRRSVVNWKKQSSAISRIPMTKHHGYLTEMKGKKYVFDFETDISAIEIPETLNNPFGSYIPDIARIAAEEFQLFIDSESAGWEKDDPLMQGKMFGVLVVEIYPGKYGYLATNSGSTPADKACLNFTPSVFDVSTDDFFISKGMQVLSEISSRILNSDNPTEIDSLRASRKLKSHALQKQLFENYQFINVLGKWENVVSIFEQSTKRKPPSAAGDCAAPKLLQHAFEIGLKPIALTEFWWGKPSKNMEREHKVFYPACKSKCRPILEYMLDDYTLYDRAKDEQD